MRLDGAQVNFEAQVEIPRSLQKRGLGHGKVNALPTN